MTIHILLADDHTILRAGLKMMLNAQPDMEVIGEADNGIKALELARPASQSPVRVRLLGRFTEDCFDPRPAFQQRGLQHLVEVGGQVPYAEALRAMTQADILLLLDTPGRKVSIPHLIRWADALGYDLHLSLHLRRSR